MPAQLHREGRLAALPARPAGQCFVAREHFPAVLALAVPRSLLLFFKKFYCSRNKTSSGCHRDRGQVVFLQSSGHPGLGPGCRAELERTARPAAAEDWLRGGREPNIYVIF